MIEEIKLLIPLLENTGDSAFWLIMVYISVDFMTHLIFLIATYIIIKMIIEKSVKISEPNELQDICANKAVYHEVIHYITLSKSGSYFYATDFKNLSETITKYEKDK